MEGIEVVRWNENRFSIRFNDKDGWPQCVAVVKDGEEVDVVIQFSYVAIEDIDKLILALQAAKQLAS